MIFPDFAQFSALAQQGNFVPVYQEWVADLETPVSAWYKVCAGQPYSFLLESVEGGETVGRYSFLGCDPLWTLEARGDQTIQTLRDGATQTFVGDPFQALSTCLEPFRPVKLPQLPPGIGGLFGFWGYELIHWVEPRVPIYAVNSSSDTSTNAVADVPDGLWMQIDQLLIFDQVQRKIWAIAYADLRDPQVDRAAAYQGACDRVNQLVQKLQLPLSSKDTLLQWTPPGQTRATSKTSGQTQASDLIFDSNFTQAEFCANVERAKDYIRAGDIFQVVITVAIHLPCTAPYD
jgi:anthranilate synthase component I